MPTFKPLTESDVSFEVICHPEEIPVRGNACGHDGSDDCEAWIFSELDRGNEWAWCCVEVKATWGDFEASDYLGECSYASEKDFSAPDGYLPQMKDEALSALNAIVEGAYNTLKMRIVD